MTQSSPHVAAENDSPGWRPWLVYVAPFAIYMLLNTLEPGPPDPAKPDAQAAAPGGILAIPYQYYPLVYTIKIAVTAAFLIAVARDLARLSWRVSPRAIGVGIVGVAVWIGICELHLEERLLAPLGLASYLGLGARAAYNPLAELGDRPLLAYTFLAVRFLGLVVIVPIVEELFWRGFLMRFITDQRWWTLPLVAVSWTGVAVATAAFASAHPAELLAAIAWFSLVTWLMFRTQNLTDCVVAHGTTNLLLGLYVVATGSWRYW
ncbi:MAG: CAAX prenyl protease-related protein [Pirellulales bacterium]|nr:CAAX prenyl protease-related protein [Pirellulales bacterium]